MRKTLRRARTQGTSTPTRHTLKTQGVGTDMDMLTPMTFEDVHELLEEEEYAEALPILTAIALGGNVDAQISLGNCYYFGDGVERNRSFAAEWYRRAAEQGNADAQYILGGCYDKGDGVERNWSLAVEWYQKAAVHGFAGAQELLGRCYANGIGVDQDKSTAEEWFWMAGNQGVMSE